MNGSLQQDDLGRFFAVKDPAEILDYGWSWVPWLQEGEAIATYTCSVPPGITKVVEDFVGTTTMVCLSGGTVGQRYAIEMTIVTNATQPRTFVRSFDIVVMKL